MEPFVTDLMQTDAVGTLHLSRTIERILIVLFGGLSIVLGWNLFRAGVVADQRADLEGASFTVRLIRVGPGVFFALFGAGILVMAMSTVIEVRVTPGGGGTVPAQQAHGGVTIAGLLKSDREALLIAQTLSSVTQIVSPVSVNSADGLSKADQLDLLAHRTRLIEIRDWIVAERLGREAVVLWNQNAAKFRTAPYNLDAGTREKMEEIKPWFLSNM